MENYHLAALALLENCRHVLTGREIEICEHVIENSDPEDEYQEPFSQIIEGKLCDCPHCGQEYQEDDKEEFDSDSQASFLLLLNQFYREICGWIDARDRIVCARTTQSQAMLFAA